MAANPTESSQILVVGAGPVGLTMACELARHGVRCRIVDEGPGPTEQSRALGIQARTLEVFEQMGVVDEVLARARKIHGVGVFADGQRISHITFDLEALETHYPYLLVLPQGETERILVERLKSHGIEVERRTKFVGLSQDDSGVWANLVDDEGRCSRIHAPWLVGCDGARSIVRKALDLPFEGAEYEESFLLADVRLDWDRPEDEFTIILTPDGPLVAFPFHQPGRCRLVHASSKPLDPSQAVPDQVVARFEAMLHANGCPRAVVAEPTWTSVFKIHRRVAERFRRGRCFIAGDAAHIHSPVGGQGMNTGIQDAYNLAWKLALVEQGASPDSLLDSYSLERRSVVAGVVQGSDLATRVVTLRNPLAKSLRNHLAGLLGEFDFIARKLSKTVSELGVEYHQSPIVHEDRAGGLRSGLADVLDFRGGPHPGDRVPDVLLEPPRDSEGPRRLFEVLRGTKHVLLLFEGAHGVEDAAPFQSVLELARKHSARIEANLVVRGDVAPPWISWDGPTVLDHLGELHHRFGARGPCLYLVRPDGYLGYRSMPPDSAKLASYLGRIFVS
jgi:2-polyprenyl-6-methoxyphenol hydroxylase-like FAD-dependent oxidoreductase